MKKNIYTVMRFQTAFIGSKLKKQLLINMGTGSQIILKVGQI